MLSRIFRFFRRNVDQRNFELPGRAASWPRQPVGNTDFLLLTGTASSRGSPDPKGALVAVSFFAGGRKLPGPLPGYSRSRLYGAYRYIPVTRNAEIEFRTLLPVPPGADQLALSFHLWKSTNARFADIALGIPDGEEAGTPVNGDRERAPSRPVNQEHTSIVIDMAGGGTSGPSDGQTFELPEIEERDYVVGLKGVKKLLFSGKTICDSPLNPKGALVDISFFSGDGRMNGPFAFYPHSKDFDAYHYLPAGSGSGFEKLLPMPEGAERMKISLRPWQTKDARFRDVRLRIVPEGETVEESSAEGARAESPKQPEGAPLPVRALAPAGEGPFSLVEYDDFELAGQEARQQLVPVGEGDLLILRGKAVGDNPDPKGALVALSFLATGAEMAGPFQGLSNSKRFRAYRYLPVAADPANGFELLLSPPRGADSMRLSFHVWQSQSVRLVDVTLQTLYSAGAVSTVVDGLGVANYRLLAQLLHERGELTARIEALGRAYALSGSEGDRSALNMARGVMRELDPAWQPRIHISAPNAPKKSAHRKLRIAHLHKVAYPFENSGGSIRNHNTVRSQVEAGLNPFVVTPLFYPEGIPDRRLWKRRLEGVDFHHFCSPAGKVQLPRDVLLQYDAYLTAEVLIREKPALIHAASGFRGYELALKALPIAEALRVPLIYEVRSFHEHLWGPHATMESEMTRLRMAQEDRCMAAAAAVVTISEAMKDALVERGVDAAKLSVVPNAIGEEFVVDPEGIATKKAELDLEGGTVVGYISNFSAREGHDVLLKALALLRSQGVDVKGLLVGDGATRPAMERLAGELGLADTVRFTGEVDHSTIKEYYRSIDVFVVPRKADYAADFVTPLKPFEAMALARPLIMSDRPVTREIIGDEERGLVFETGDEAALAEKIRTLMDRPDLAADMTDRARAWVLANRTWRSNAESYRDLYADILKERAP